MTVEPVGPRASSPFSVEVAFWRGRRVFLTGHTGFKGSWLADLLTQMGASVFGCELAPNAENAAYTALALDEVCDSTIAVLRDLRALQTALTRTCPEVVFHLAAQ